MFIRTFRNKEFIDRDKEIKFLLERFNEVPDEILWLYGPKSCGKTTLIEYVVEKELFEDFENLKPRDNYWVRYVNLRGKLISSYGTFFESFIKSEEDYEVQKSISAGVSIAVITLKAEVLKQVKERKKDLFDALIDELYKKVKKENKKPILIIDEIQTLEEIYINGERELLKEFLNFCVRLTKETHLSHVVILSSNTIFINRIYNEAKLKETSTFYKIDHLDKDTVFEYLDYHKIPKDKQNLIWDYLGGSIYRLQKFLRDKNKLDSIEEYLKEQVNLAFSEIKHIFIMEMENEEIDIFKQIAKTIAENGFYLLKDKEDKKFVKVVSSMSQKEILFFDPLSDKIKGNNRLYEKAFEK
ncbi:ATP-binding protein [Hippea alviniae]|uniref:ATP-binding protein n=1 Tax=Hippea alviniae TaxID=1279027 RepID=UPI0003B5FD8F|nr:ATP-binding protein [Hippea alviniae]